MENESKPETLVAGILERLADGVGTIKVWGGHAVRPSDQFYEVKAASLEASLLRVVLFLRLDGSEHIIEAEGIVGAKVTGTGLRVREATRVRVFGQEFLPRAGAADPALFLGP